MVKKPLVYVAGPITKGVYTANVRNGIDAARSLQKTGFVVLVPMLDFLMGLVHPDISYEEFLDFDFQWILRCDAIFRLPGISPGADREEEFAKANNIPVFTSYVELNIWKNTVYGQEKRCCGQYS